MFCKNCGKEIDKDSKFCKYCGTALEEECDEITLIVYNEVISRHFSVTLSNEKTYSDLFETLIKMNILPTVSISIRSAVLFDKNRNFIADTKTTSKFEDEYIYNNAPIVLTYQEMRPEIHNHNHYGSPRDIVCLYGCPNSKKNKR